MSIHAFLRLQHVQDVFDLIELLKRGAVVGLEPVPGSIFGPAVACALTIKPIKRLGYTTKTTASLSFAPTDLSDFLRCYLGEARPFKRLRLPPGCPDEDVIRKVYTILNEGAARPLTRIGLIKLAQALAAHYGGTIEPQMSYGAPEWVDYVKGRHGWLTLWHRPSDAEIRDIVQYGARGIVNGLAAEARRPWFVGVSGPYLMPDKGYIDFDPHRAPDDAWDVSGQPTGLGETWDYIRHRYRLCGLQVPADTSDDDWKIYGRIAWTHSGGKGYPPFDLPVKPTLAMPRDGAAEVLSKTWGEWFRVDFT